METVYHCVDIEFVSCEVLVLTFLLQEMCPCFRPCCDLLASPRNALSCCLWTWALFATAKALMVALVTPSAQLPEVCDFRWNRLCGCIHCKYAPMFVVLILLSTVCTPHACHCFCWPSYRCAFLNIIPREIVLWDVFAPVAAV